LKKPSPTPKNHPTADAPVYETEEVVRLPERFPFTTPADYDYFPGNPLFRAGHFLLTAVLWVLFMAVDFLWFGLRIRGRKNLAVLKKSGAVTICNHIHFLDCVFSACAIRRPMPAFLTLESNFRLPVIRRLIRILGAIPLPETRGGFLRMNQAVRDHLKKGGVLQVYPEHVLHPYYPGIRGFRRGAFAFAADAGVPVIPLVLTPRPPRGLWRLKRKPCLTLTVLPPIWPDPSLLRKKAASTLMDAAYAAMKNHYENQCSSRCMEKLSRS